MTNVGYMFACTKIKQQQKNKEKLSFLFKHQKKSWRKANERA
jgi:hypothetical protein